MATNSERILAALKRADGSSDSELRIATGVEPHQQVNQICRQLATERQRDGKPDVSETDNGNLFLLESTHRSKQSMIPVGETSVLACHSLATVSRRRSSSSDEKHTQEATLGHEPRKLDELLFA